MMLTRAPDPDRWARERGHPILREPVLAHDSRDWREAARAEGASPSADFPCSLTHSHSTSVTDVHRRWFVKVRTIPRTYESFRQRASSILSCPLG